MDTNFFNQIQTQLDPVLGNHYVQVLIVIMEMASKAYCFHTYPQHFGLVLSAVSVGYFG